MNEAPAQPFDVPWRIRDPLYVILCTTLALFVFEAFVGISLGFSLAFEKIRLTNEFSRALFEAPSWTNLRLTLDLLLSAFFLSVFMLRRGVTGPVRLFVPSQTAWDVRYALRLFLKSLLYILLLGLAVMLVVFIAAFLTGHNPHSWMDAYHQQAAKERISRVSPSAGWFPVLMLTLVGPPLEEAIFRGGFYAALRKKWTPWKANLASSGLFAILHFYIVGLPYVFLLGILTAYGYERTRSLTVPILVHVLWNSFTFSFNVPWMRPVLALLLAVLVLVACRARGESPFEAVAKKKHKVERIGWKVYAWLFVPAMVSGCLSQSHAVLYLLAEIPVYVAVFSYAYGLRLFPKKAWAVYALFYTVYVLYDFWDMTHSGGARLRLSEVMAGVGIYALTTLPSFVVLWRLAVLE